MHLAFIVASDGVRARIVGARYAVLSGNISGVRVFVTPKKQRNKARLFVLCAVNSVKGGYTVE